MEALFDNLKNLKSTFKNTQIKYQSKDPQKFKELNCAYNFIVSYNGSEATFNAYRREIERLIQWSWLIYDKSFLKFRREDIEKYLNFCQNPLKSWIGNKNVNKFIIANGIRIANPNWRPFVATISKQARKQGQEVDINKYCLSESALKDIFSILGSFYNFLIQEEICDINPIALIRQKSKFIRKKQGKDKIRRLSTTQWQKVMKITENLANSDPDKYERSLFIISTLYLMYLRISEITASNRWTPKMNDFYCDHDNNWWFTVVGKGNKERDIAVSDAMIEVLTRWRKHLGLTKLPSPADNSYLLPKNKGQGAISSTTFVRKIVQTCFDLAYESLKQENSEQADALAEATVHWLRHTGISDDVKFRPREHVRDDAGHSSGATTDKYIDIERKERHKSARKKKKS